MCLSMNAISPSPVSLFAASGFPAIPSPTICGVLAGRGGFLHAAPPLPEGFTLHDRLRLSYAGSPTDADRIEFTLPAIAGGRCYGLAVLVPLLSTPCCHDAVTVRYLTILHRMEVNFHHFNRTPSQAHVGRALRSPPGPGGQRRRHNTRDARFASCARHTLKSSLRITRVAVSRCAHLRQRNIFDVVYNIWTLIDLFLSI
jgi:hypothetical protein